MAGTDMIKRVTDLYHVDPVKCWVQRALMDFNDTEVAFIIAKYRPETIWDLYDALVMQTNDPDVHAHLLGFASAEDRRIQQETFRKSQETVQAEIDAYQHQLEEKRR